MSSKSRGPYFSHCFPIVEPPINGTVMRDFRHRNIGDTSTAVDIGPDVYRKARAVADPIWSIATSCFAKYTVGLFAKNVERCNR